VVPSRRDRDVVLRLPAHAAGESQPRIELPVVLGEQGDIEHVGERRFVPGGVVCRDRAKALLHQIRERICHESIGHCHVALVVGKGERSIESRGGKVRIARVSHARAQLDGMGSVADSCQILEFKPGSVVLALLAGKAPAIEVTLDVNGTRCRVRVVILIWRSYWKRVSVTA